MKRSEIFFSVLLVPVDFVMVILGFTMAYLLRDRGFVWTPGEGILGSSIDYGTFGSILAYPDYLRSVLPIVPLMLGIFALTGLYAMRGALPWGKRIVRIFLGVSVGMFFILLLFLLRNTFFLPRATVLYAWVFCFLTVVLGRLLVRAAQHVLRRYGIGVIRLGIIGPENVVAQIMRGLQRHPNPLHRLDVRFDSLEVESIVEQITADNLDELIVVNEKYNTQDLIKLRNHCMEHQVTFSFIPGIATELPESTYGVRTEIGLPAIEIRPTPLEGWGRVGKRMFDIFASMVLIVAFSPFFIVIAIVMKLKDRGPLIYKNERLGKDMNPILVWKFRTMKTEYCDGPGYSGASALKKYLDSHPEAAQEWKETSKLKNDPRVSGIGKFLRRSSLDELPQLFNVLVGSLSLVGPRPIVRNELHDEVAKYGEAARLLFTVKPGMTGLWQISGRNDVSFDERVALDLKYIEHWNIWWDLLIAVKTVGVFMPRQGKGGY